MVERFIIRENENGFHKSKQNHCAPRAVILQGLRLTMPFPYLNSYGGIGRQLFYKQSDKSKILFDFEGVKKKDIENRFQCEYQYMLYVYKHPIY